MRYQPDDPAFEGDFIEFSDRWSRAQVRGAWDTAGKDEAKFLSILRGKIVALHLTCEDADPITDPADLTPTRTEQMDTVLYTWFAYAWIVHLNELANLGNALGRGLLPTSDGQTQATPAQSNPTS